MSKYMNNTTFKHSSIAFLRMYFERNTKQIDTSFTKWGNVFRNNKWTDLKIQNVKTSFLDQKKQILLYFFLFLFLFNILNFSDFTFNSWTSFYNRGIDIVYQVFFILGLFIHHFFKKYLSKWSSNNVNLILTSDTDASINKNLLTKSPVFNNEKNLSSNYVKSMKNSYKVSSLLSKSKNLDITNFDNLDLLKNNKFEYVILKNLNLVTKNHYETYSDLYVTDLISKNQKNIDYTLSINEVNNLFKNNPDYQNLVINLGENTNIAKQIRWKSLNSISLDGLAISNKTLTDSKQLIGSNSFNSNSVSSNMWWSNASNLNYRPLDTNFRFDNNIKNLLEGNLNYLEVSKEFVIKKNHFKTLNSLMFTVDSLLLNEANLSKNNSNKLNLLLNTENVLNALNSVNYNLINNSDLNNSGVLFNDNLSSKLYMIKNENSELLSWELLNILNTVPTTNNGLELEIPKFTYNSKSNIKFNW